MASQEFGRQRKWAMVLLAVVLGTAAWLGLGRSSGGINALGSLLGIGEDTTGSSSSANAMKDDALPAYGTLGGVSRAAAGTDALGRRFNENEDLVGEPALPAKPLPVVAAKGQVIGYSKGANGQATPIYANASRIVPNTPGTYVAVDMWADGGARVVSVRQEAPLSPTEASRLEDMQQPGRGGGKQQ